MGTSKGRSRKDDADFAASGVSMNQLTDPLPPLDIEKLAEVYKRQQLFPIRALPQGTRIMESMFGVGISHWHYAVQFHCSPEEEAEFWPFCVPTLLSSVGEAMEIYLRMRRMQGNDSVPLVRADDVRRLLGAPTNETVLQTIAVFGPPPSIPVTVRPDEGPVLTMQEMVLAINQISERAEQEGPLPFDPDGYPLF